MPLIDGAALAKKINTKTAKQCTVLRTRGVVPHLAILQIGNNSASESYTAIKQRTAEKVGVNCLLRKFASGVSAEEVSSLIKKWNTDPSVHGILVQLPLPRQYDQRAICDLITWEKDVDCLSDSSLARLASGDTRIIPPTAEAVLRCIQLVAKLPRGARCTVIGAGIFGRQIALHLLNQHMTVLVAHLYTSDLAALTKQSAVVVSVVGQAGLVTGAMITKDATVIDVGVSRTQDTVTGDVDVQSVLKKGVYVTPTPGGTGPVTVAVLLERLVDAVSRLTDTTKQL